MTASFFLISEMEEFIMLKKPRILAENEIHLMAVPISLKKIELIPYVDRMTVMSIMDETFGIGRWTVEHNARSKADGSTEMSCRISVYDDELKTWISRDDYGLGSNDKIQATDSFKRACVMWGVASELYTLPDEHIFIDAYRPATDNLGRPIIENGMQTTTILANVEQQEDGTLICPDHFGITQYLIDPDLKQITAIAIKNLSTQYMVYVVAKDSKAKDKSKSRQKTENTPALSYYESMIPDVGKFARNQIPMRELDKPELLWLFGHTKSEEIKKGILVILHCKPEFKDIFIAQGIYPDIEYKKYF